jgi:phosphoglycolate phosphatase
VDPCRLVLWDIDLTLLATGGEGPEVRGLAFAERYGRAAEHEVEVSGRTDRAIARAYLAANRAPHDDGEVTEFLAALASAHGSRLDALRANGRSMPGAHEALAALGRVPGTVQSVLTGNQEAVARQKLAAFGFTRPEHGGAALDLDVGAYGADDDDRAALVPVARGRAARATGTGFEGRATVLIGDTVEDVRAARENGAAVIAVASGRYTTTQLADAGADHVLPDLSATPDVVAAVLGV